MMRDIAHINIPDFPIETARVVDSGLREKPVIVASGNSSRAVITCSSREARKEGVKTGMYLSQAMRYCRTLSILQPEPQLYQTALTSVTKLISNYSPTIELSSPGHLYLDISGTKRLFGNGEDLIARIQKEMKRELSLKGALGLASNKLVARIAAHVIDAKEILFIPRGTEAGFLAPIKVRHLPVNEDIGQQLIALLNINLIGQITTIPLANIIRVFGKHGFLLYDQAQGIDNTPVIPKEATLEVSEDMTLPEDTNHLDEVARYLKEITEKVGERLRNNGYGAKELALTISYSDGVEKRLKTRINCAVDNISMFEKLYTIFKKQEKRTRIRWLRISASNIVNVNYQTSIFKLAGREKREALSYCIDDIRERFGRQIIRCA